MKRGDPESIKAESAFEVNHITASLTARFREPGGRYLDLSVGFVGRRTTMSALAEFMEEFEDGPVVDRTGLSGEYDFTLSWTRGVGDRIERKDRLLEEMGLVLRRVPVRHFVVDTVQRPLID